MYYSLHFTPQALHLSIAGYFTFIEAGAFCRTLTRSLKGNRRPEIRLDVEGVSYADSTAINLLMKAHDMAKAQNCRLIFERPQGKLREMLAEASRCNALNIAA